MGWLRWLVRFLSGQGPGGGPAGESRTDQHGEDRPAPDPHPWSEAWPAPDVEPARAGTTDTTLAAALARMSERDLRDALRLRLVSVDALPTVEGLPHLRALAPGLVEILTLDLPTAIITPAAESVAALGAPSVLVRRGRDNLRLELADLHRHTIRAADGLTFAFVSGEHYYVASLALVLPALLQHVADVPAAAKGVFVGVPNRHHLAYRIVDDLPSLMAVGPMASFTRNGYDEGDGPVSPHTYWVRGPRLDDWHQLTVQTTDGIEIHVPAELTALVEQD